jgi:hypothetical protein
MTQLRHLLMTFKIHRMFALDLKKTRVEDLLKHVAFALQEK